MIIMLNTMLNLPPFSSSCQTLVMHLTVLNGENFQSKNLTQLIKILIITVFTCKECLFNLQRTSGEYL